MATALRVVTSEATISISRSDFVPLTYVTHSTTMRTSVAGSVSLWSSTFVAPVFSSIAHATAGAVLAVLPTPEISPRRHMHLVR